MKEQLLKTWQIHQRMNELLLENLGPSALEITLGKKGGRTIAQQFTHIHNVRLQWLALCAKDLADGYKSLGKDADPTQLILLKSLRESAQGIAYLISHSWADGGKLKNFKAGLIPFLGYLISHESHHRGNIILTLKLIGEKIPDKVKWGLWEWNK